MRPMVTVLVCLLTSSCAGRIQPGMTKAEVTLVAGIPAAVEYVQGHDVWYFPDQQVWFKEEQVKWTQDEKSTRRVK
jgi:outer membrane protein assembly factor BamE (lipoprotein component of BamABCDE complex)